MFRKSIVLGLAFLALGAARARAQERALLYSRSSNGALAEATATVRTLSGTKVPYAQLSRSTVFYVRIVPRRIVLNADDTPQENAVLGGKPFVFFTTPQSLSGRTLLDMYQDIGYEAEDIVRWQRNEDMVALVFRYPGAIARTEMTDGKLPEDSGKKVYIPTWENVFSLFERLAERATVQPEKRGEFAPEVTFFRSSQEKAFVLSFPEDGKKRLKRAGYAELKAIGGADWTYRRLLETKLSIFEHFLGTGRTHNEVLDPDGLDPEAGLFEFVGPNLKLKDLPDLAVVHLGSLSIKDTYSVSANPGPKAK